MTWAITTIICLLIIYYLIIYIINLRKRVGQSKSKRKNNFIDLIIYKLIIYRRKKRNIEVKKQVNLVKDLNVNHSVDIKYLYNDIDNIKNTYIRPKIDDKFESLGNGFNQATNNEEEKITFSELLKGKPVVSNNLLEWFTKLENKHSDQDNDDDNVYANEIGLEYMEGNEEIAFRDSHVQPTEEELDNLSSTNK